VVYGWDIEGAFPELYRIARAPAALWVIIFNIKAGLFIGM
jgi:hypothetical protein